MNYLFNNKDISIRINYYFNYIFLYYLHKKIFVSAKELFHIYKYKQFFLLHFTLKI